MQKIIVAIVSVSLSFVTPVQEETHKNAVYKSKVRAIEILQEPNPDVNIDINNK